MTNAERKRRKLYANDACPLFQEAAGTTDHILRLYAKTKEVCQQLGLLDNTLALNLTEWMATHLKNPHHDLMFGVATWYYGSKETNGLPA
ncbi:unnamed protein product [Linum trigynum]|uniref:Uncharacterized protein n=1 Tax=Linum trigynum TaxID=586398 RepID=A0AAV2EPT0_9ROSI